MPTWVKLTSVQHIEQGGVQRTYYPGDWVKLGRQYAQRLIAAGEATRPSGSFETPAGAGIVTRGAVVQTDITDMLPVAEDPGYLAFPLTLYWNPSYHLRPELVSVGFSLLETWQVLAPLVSYERLAAHFGSEADRERTRDVVRDLRVPVYDSRLVWFRRCADTVELFGRWKQEREGGGDEDLAFLRALYLVKPTVLALPVTWSLE